MKEIEKIIIIAITLLQLTLNAEVNNISIGAIRWDAWTGSDNLVGDYVNHTLSPERYHYRIPFYGVVQSSDSVTIDATRQDIMDQEISYATYAGIDYWAFLWYPASSGLDQSRMLYYSSKKKSMIHYSLIVEPQHFTVDLSIDSLISEFSDSSYMRVNSGRPLLYFFGYQGIQRDSIDTLRARSIARGFGNPYIVELRVDGNINVLDSLNMDAFSMYASTWLTDGVPYSDLASADVGQWDWMGKSNNKPVVPHVTVGWDKRPRADYYNPDGYNDYNPDYAKSWVQKATASQIVDHIDEAIKWSKNNPTIANAQTVLVYAWNEHDEGGWLCPTLSMYGGTERIETMHNRWNIQVSINNHNKYADDRSMTTITLGNNIFIDIPKGDNIQKISVYNTQGRKVLSSNYYKGIKLDNPNISSGIYIISIKTNSGLFNQQIWFR